MSDTTSPRRGTQLGSPLLKGTIVVLFLASPIVTRRLAPNSYEGGYSRDTAQLEERNSSAFAMLLGEFRTSMADMMFIKTERYLHSGVGYSAHINLDRTAQTGEIETDHPEEEHHYHGDGHDHGPELDPDDPMAAPSLKFTGEMEAHQQIVASGGVEAIEDDAGTPTMIRSAANDFRGFIGDLERQVQPYQAADEAHVHTDGTELLPWYRLLTLTDPHNVRGYMIGAWWLAGMEGGEKVEEAIAFLEEGIRNNPRSFQLPMMKGTILHRAERRQESLASYIVAAELVAQIRPRDPEKEPWWTEYMEEDALASVRLAVIQEKEVGDWDKALEMANRYNAVFPGGDHILKRQIEELRSAPKPER